jgi:hypothetical protein
MERLSLCGPPMSVIPTSPASASLPAKTIELSPAHVLAIALLACVPVPLLSLVETAVPIPDLVARAAATFIPFVDSTQDKGTSSVLREPTAQVQHRLAVPADAAHRSVLIRAEASTGLGRGARTTPARESGAPSPGPAPTSRTGTATAGTGDSAQGSSAAATDPVAGVTVDRSLERTDTGNTSEATDKKGGQSKSKGSTGGYSVTGKGSSSAKGSSSEKQTGADKGSGSDKGSGDTSPTAQGNAPTFPPGEPETPPADPGSGTHGANNGGGHGGNGTS